MMQTWAVRDQVEGLVGVSRVPERFRLIQVKPEFDEHECMLRAFTPEAAGLVTETTWHHTQKVRRQKDGAVTLTFEVDGLEEILVVGPRVVGTGPGDQSA